MFSNVNYDTFRFLLVFSGLKYGYLKYVHTTNIKKKGVVFINYRIHKNYIN